MTRKHYRAIATILSTHLFSGAPYHELPKLLADYFEAIDPKFDRAAFLMACATKKGDK